MTFGEQKTMIQKWTGNRETDYATLIGQALNAEYLRYTKAFPSLVTIKVGQTFNTTASLRNNKVATDAGRLIRAWLQDGNEGYDGSGTIEVWTKEHLVQDYPNFHTETGSPRVMAPVAYDGDGYLLVNFDRLPDAVYAVYLDYYLKVTALSSDSAEMSVALDAQMEITHRAARKLVPTDSTAFAQLNSILGLDNQERDLADQDAPDNAGAWMIDPILEDRRVGYYQRYGRG